MCTYIQEVVKLKMFENSPCPLLFSLLYVFEQKVHVIKIIFSSVFVYKDIFKANINKTQNNKS